MNNIGITRFATRQIGVTNESSIGGFLGTSSELINILKLYSEEEAKPGFAPFVRVVEIRPEHLWMFLGTFREAHKRETLMVRLESRRTGELPVPVSYLIGDKEVPDAARVILYSREVLAAEGEADGLEEFVEWAVVSINLGPSDEPMAPTTMWRNYWASRDSNDPRGKGGSPHWAGKSDEDFLRELYRSESYWANRGRVVRELPPIAR
jgi:hypothetical protein